jgi:hypothetical protein
MTDSCRSLLLAGRGTVSSLLSLAAFSSGPRPSQAKPPLGALAVQLTPEEQQPARAIDDNKGDASQDHDSLLKITILCPGATVHRPVASGPLATILDAAICLLGRFADTELTAAIAITSGFRSVVQRSLNGGGCRSSEAGLDLAKSDREQTRAKHHKAGCGYCEESIGPDAHGHPPVARELSRACWHRTTATSHSQRISSGSAKRNLIDAL